MWFSRAHTVRSKLNSSEFSQRSLKNLSRLSRFILHNGNKVYTIILPIVLTNSLIPMMNKVNTHKGGALIDE